MSDNSVPNSYYQALVRFAQTVGANDPVNQSDGPSPQYRMTDADRQFLQGALAQFVNEADPVKRMKANLELLLSSDFNTTNQEVLDSCVDALENTSDLCSDIDLSCDFLRIGGFRILPGLLGSSNAKLRAATANLIAELTQNNPEVQHALQDTELLPVLIELFTNDKCETVRQKALYAITGLIRNHTALEARFIEQYQGIDKLLTVVSKSEVPRITVKAMFILNYLLHDLRNVQVVMKSNSNRLIKSLKQQACDSKDIFVREYALSALVSILKHCYADCEHQFRADNFEQYLDNRIKQIDNNQQLLEELALAQELLDSLQGRSASSIASPRC